jgi:NitT/TauT family transport system substrate-binding protein
VTDYISAYSKSGHLFIPRMFQGFPEIKEALISNQMQAAFMVAPMAIALRAQGVPVKIVYLGHRYGSAVVVRKNGPVHSFADLKGKTVAIPSRRRRWRASDASSSTPANTGPTTSPASWSCGKT